MNGTDVRGDDFVRLLGRFLHTTHADLEMVELGAEDVLSDHGPSIAQDKQMCDVNYFPTPKTIDREL